jgi:hypothetical protein
MVQKWEHDCRLRCIEWLQATHNQVLTAKKRICSTCSYSVSSFVNKQSFDLASITLVEPSDLQPCLLHVIVTVFIVGPVVKLVG